MRHTIGCVLLAAPVCAFLLVGCGSGFTLGDTAAVKEAGDLAIACRHDDALSALDRAAAAGGFSKEIADLERAVILRDAGREAEADAALADRNRRVGADAKAAAEAENAVAESLGKLRAEREKKTGSPTCP